MENEIILNGNTYILKEQVKTSSDKDENGNIKCKGCQDTHNSTRCNNSTGCNNSTRCNNSTECNNSIGCDNSTGCNNSTGCDNSTWCNNSTRCDNSTGCDNSTWCDNSTGCNNSTECNNCAYCIYCNDLTLEKFKIFNKSVKTKEAFIEIREKITSQLGYYKHPKELTESDIKWLKENIEQFDKEVLDKVIENSILPDKPINKKVDG